MLFMTDLTYELAQDENVLVEHLYAFLKEYVNMRLTVESRPEKEDCVQESIMYLLKRYRQLDEETKQNLNLGKFFYNRAHSYISGYISKLKAARKSEIKYKGLEKYELELKQSEDNEPDFIDYDILEPIIKAYKLEKEKENLLREFAEQRLAKLGYDTPTHTIKKLDKNTHQLLLNLSFAVIDEYMINSTKEKANV